MTHQQIKVVTEQIDGRTFLYFKKKNIKKGSYALSGKMLLARIIENNKIYAFLGQVRLSKG